MAARWRDSSGLQKISNAMSPAFAGARRATAPTSRAHVCTGKGQRRSGVIVGIGLLRSTLPLYREGMRCGGYLLSIRIDCFPKRSVKMCLLSQKKRVSTWVRLQPRGRPEPTELRAQPVRQWPKEGDWGDGMRQNGKYRSSRLSGAGNCEPPPAVTAESRVVVCVCL